MTDILKEIRTHLINSKVITDSECKFNITTSDDEIVCLWIYGGYREVLGDSPTIQIKVLSKDARQAENKINAILKALVTTKPIRISTINNKKMRIVEAQQPFFVEKDTQQRFVWVFNITVTAF